MADGTVTADGERLLAPAAELATRSGRPEADSTLLSRLAAASSRFRSAVHWSVNEQIDERIYLVGSGSSLLLLPAQRVTGVASVAVDGSALLPGAWRLHRGLNALRAVQGRWPAGAEVEVVYTYGYPDDAIPGDVQEAVLQMAETLLNVTAGLSSRTVLGDTMQFGTAATVGATQDWSTAVSNHIVGRGDRA